MTRLQRERHARGWSQQQVIDRLKRLAYERGYGQRFDGLDSNTLSRYEHGRIRRPRAPLPELFAALYEVPVSELFPARRPAATWAPKQRSGLGVVGGELVEVVIPALGRPVVRVGDRRIDASADRLLDAPVAAVVASVRALLAAVVNSASGEQGRPVKDRLNRRVLPGGPRLAMAPAGAAGSWPPRVAAGASGPPCGGGGLAGRPGVAARPGPSTAACGRRAQCPEAGGLVVNRELGKHCSAGRHPAMAQASDLGQ